MRFVKCGTKLFDPNSVTAVTLYAGPSRNEVTVSTPGDVLIFSGDEAEAVRTYFLRMPAQDLMQRPDDDAPEATAVNHSREEC